MILEIPALSVAFSGAMSILGAEKSARQSPLHLCRGGKSGLHRAKCQITSGRRKPTASAAENIPPKHLGAGKVEMVR